MHEALPPSLLADADWVRRLARALVGDAAAADDLAQEALVAALERGSDESAPSRRWFAAVLRNRARLLHRGHARRAARERVAARDEALEPSDALVVRAESLRRAVGLVLALEEPYRSTVLLRYLEELSPSAIAARQGVPVATVKTRLQRALERLRRAAAEREGDARPAWLVALAATHGVSRTGWIAGGMLVGTKVQHYVLALAALACLAAIGGHAWRTLSPDVGTEAPRVESPPVADASEVERVNSTIADEVERTAVALDPVEAREAELAAAPDTLLTGIVADRLGRAIEGARLEVWFDPAAGFSVLWQAKPAREHVTSGETDAEGRFALVLAPGRPHELEVRAEGFAPVLVADCTPGQELRVVVERGARLRGKVVSAEDEDLAVPGGRVRVFHGDWMVEVPVDEQGRFALDDMVPGEIGLLALPEHAAMNRYQSMSVERGNVLDAKLVVAKGLEVSGRVSDARSGAPIAGARVSTNTDRSKSVLTDAGGRYRLLGVDSSRPARIFADAPGYAPAQTILTPERNDEIEFGLEPERVVSGRVVDHTGRALRGAHVLAYASQHVPAEDPYIGYARSDANGGFRLAGVRPDLDYALLVHAAGHAPTVFDGLVAALGDSPLDLGELRLEEPALIAGRVIGPSGQAARALLQLAPDFGPGTSAGFVGMRPFHANEDGRFALGDVAPGRYLLRAVAENVAHEELPIELRPGERLTGLEIRIDPRLAIRGAVFDESGAPLAGVSVQSRREDGDWSMESYFAAKTDERGWFALPGLAPGAHRITAWLGDASRGEAPFEVASVPSVEPDGPPLEIVLRRLDRRVSGIVVDTDGEPLPLAYVWVERGAGRPTRGVLSDEAGRFELPVRLGEAIELVAHRTMHLYEAVGDTSSESWDVGRHIAPKEAGEARLAGVQAGATELVLRMSP